MESSKMATTISSTGTAADHYMKRLMDQVPSMLAYWDRDLLCRFANQAYAQWFGVNPDTLPGTSIKDLLGPDLFSLNEAHIQAVLRGEEQLFERLIPGPHGVKRHSLANYVPDRVNGEVIGFMVQVTDITKLKDAQSALQDSEQKFRALSASLPLGVYHADASGSLTYTNARWQQIHGTTSTPWLQTVHADDRDKVASAWHALVQFGAKFDIEWRILRPDGETRLVRSQAQPIQADGGTITGFVGALEDVSDQRAAEQRLRASEAFLERTGHLASVGGWELDLVTNQLTWSKQTRRIHEVGPDHQPSLQDGIHFYAPQARPVIEAAVRKGMEHGEPWDLELPFISATGRHLWVRTFGEVEFENGLPVRLTGAFQDITKYRQQGLDLQREQALRAQSERQAQELDKLSHERGEMLDVLAHEVRQPLNNASAALQSAAQSLAEMGEEIASKRLTRAQTVMGQVLAAIDNTLAVASLLARPDPIQRMDTDVDMLLSVAIADMPPADFERIRVERLTSTRTASMDVSLMRLALRNLLSNALKHGPPDQEVLVRVTDMDEPLALVIEVIDHGQGIPSELVPQLFQRGSSGKGQSLGLGLYIVRRVMELHGGHAELARNTDQGVTIRLVLNQ